MTKIKVVKNNGQIQSVEAQGHTGYGVAGEDIVCAGVSSIIQTAMLGIMAVAKINATIIKDDKQNLMRIELPKNLPDAKMHDAQTILKTMLCGVSDLHVGFSDFIELEVKEL